MGCNRQNFFVIMDRFLPFYPPIDSQNQNFEKTKKNTWRYHHFTNVYHKWQSYDIWFFRYEVQQTKIFVILDRFLPFCLPNNPKNQNFEKLKKAPRDIIILHKCTKTHDHMLYCSLDMPRNGFTCYFSFWAIFYPFTSLTSPKNQNLEKVKKNLEISSFYNTVPKIMIKCYTVPEIWYVTDVIIFLFGPFFALLPP